MIKVAIVGVGNCCSSLYQGLNYYKHKKDVVGLMKPNIGGYFIKDIEVVAAFDIDKRKIGKSIGEAIFEHPNCTPIYYKHVEKGPIVMKGLILDGVSPVMKMEKYSDEEKFLVSNEDPVDVVKILKERKVDILINYLPVGSQKATEYYANVCIEAKVCFLNCIPVFIASNPNWEQLFKNNKLTIIGDDMKSQFGASILSQILQEGATKRGYKVKAHIQRNVGGNTDFLNMEDNTRVISKKISKENVLRDHGDSKLLDGTFFHAGPSEYIRYYKDNKVANIRLELEGFLGAPAIVDVRLSVIDSPNSAGVVIDAIRYLKVANELGIYGAVRGPSAFTQKSPPMSLSFEKSLEECNLLAERKKPKCYN